MLGVPFNAIGCSNWFNGDRPHFHKAKPKTS
jgi:hypothetical protein